MQSWEGRAGPPWSFSKAVSTSSATFRNSCPGVALQRNRRCSHGLAVVVGEFGFGKRQREKTWQPRSPEVRVKGSFLQSTSQHRGGWPSLLFPHGMRMLPFSVEKSRQTQSRNLQSNSSTFSYFELFAYFYYQNVVKNLPRIINLLLLHDRK